MNEPVSKIEKALKLSAATITMIALAAFGGILGLPVYVILAAFVLILVIFTILAFIIGALLGLGFALHAAALFTATNVWYYIEDLWKK